MGRSYRERMPNCHFVMVYDAGHAVATERPILAKTRLGE
jgi:pimeloyl-ACP methyl ester carboxylesterase